MIKNKRESYQYIRRKNLNTTPELIVSKFNTKLIKEFFMKYNANLYVLRDGARTSSKYFYVRSYEEIIPLLDEYENNIIIAVSIKGYEKQLLLGTVEFTSDNKVNIICTTKQELDHRTIYLKAEFDLTTDIYDKRLNDIPHFDELYVYAHQNQLYDHIVEFTIFDSKVGSNADYIVINEVRDY